VDRRARKANAAALEGGGQVVAEWRNWRR